MQQFMRETGVSRYMLRSQQCTANLLVRRMHMHGMTIRSANFSLHVFTSKLKFALLLYTGEKNVFS